MTIATEETALARIESITAIDLFKPEIIDPILGRIREEVTSQAQKLDISTPGNRNELASLAYKVARSKTFIDGQRKNLVSDEKKRLAKIDAEGRRIWDELESLQSEVRKPLTDWENADKERIATHERELAEVETCGNNAMQTWPNYSAECIRDRMAEIEGDTRDYEEFRARHAGVKAVALRQMSDALAKREAHDSEQVELARLRAEAAEREQRDREERIARESKENAEREAKVREEKASRESAEREARLERELRLREHDVIIAKEAAEAKVKKAEADRIATEERHEQEKQAAIEAERQRIADEAGRAEAEAKAREKDKAHKASVNNAARHSLVAKSEIEGAHARLSPAQATWIITAIAKGLIPGVKVVY